MSKKRFLLFLMLVATILMGTACNVRAIRGSGNLVTESRQVSNFDRIALSGSGEVILTQDGSESLRIEADDNVMKYIEAEVEARTLKLGFKNGVNIISTTKLVFYVSVDNLTSLKVSGSGDFQADTIEADRLAVDISGSGSVQISELLAKDVSAEISGSGRIDLTGEVDTQEIDLSGSGKYLGGDLCSESVKVSVSGSGVATVCATERLDSSTSGSGSVNYYGQPSSVNTSGSGSGKTNSLGDK